MLIVLNLTKSDLSGRLSKVGLLKINLVCIEFSTSNEQYNYEQITCLFMGELHHNINLNERKLELKLIYIINSDLSSKHQFILI